MDAKKERAEYDEIRNTACHLCQIVGDGTCDIDSEDCMILPEMTRELKTALKKWAKEFLEVAELSRQKSG